MSENNRIKIWLQQIRAPFLILSVALVLLGVGSASSAGHQNWLFAGLLLIGVVLAHTSVNLFNEISDFKTRIDEHTVRTPFSGGSGMMQKGETAYKKVVSVAYFTLLLAALIGIYFTIKVGWPVLVFMVLGGIAIRFYTSHLARWLIGEIAAGITLGTLVVLGCHYVLTGYITLAEIWIAIPPGILTSLLLFLNEFPDADADKTGGRYHFIIHFGKPASARIYAGGLILVYIIILISPFLFGLPYEVLFGLLTLPLAVKAALHVLKHHSDTAELIPALGINVAIVILTDLLVAVGFFI